MAWYYGTYKEPIMSVGESGEKLRSYYLNNGYLSLGVVPEKQYITNLSIHIKQNAYIA